MNLSGEETMAALADRANLSTFSVNMSSGTHALCMMEKQKQEKDTTTHEVVVDGVIDFIFMQ